MSLNYQVVKGNDLADLELQVSHMRTTFWECQGGICVTAVNDVQCLSTSGEPIETDIDLIYYQAMVRVRGKGVYLSKKIIVKNCQECPYLTQVSSRTTSPYCLVNNRELPYTEELDRGQVVQNVEHGIPEWCDLLDV